VKTNIVHTLHRVKACGTQPLESFKEILTNEEYQKCRTNPMRGKVWYFLTLEVFVSFLFRVSKTSEDYLSSYFALQFPVLIHIPIYDIGLYFKVLFPLEQQEIAEASDEAAQRYMEDTPEGERTDAGITAAMRAAAKTKAASYRGKFSKFTVVANPKLGDKFLDEVIF
jgi:hypothetical protein